jgi:hypothetical protein
MYRIFIPCIELFLCNRHRSVYFVVVLLFYFYFAEVSLNLVVPFGAPGYVVDVGELRGGLGLVLSVGCWEGGREGEGRTA